MNQDGKAVGYAVDCDGITGLSCSEVVFFMNPLGPSPPNCAAFILLITTPLQRGVLCGAALPTVLTVSQLPRGEKTVETVAIDQ